MCACVHMCVCEGVRVGRKSEMGWVNAIEFKQISADFVFVASCGGGGRERGGLGECYRKIQT